MRDIEQYLGINGLMQKKICESNNIPRVRKSIPERPKTCLVIDSKGMTSLMKVMGYAKVNYDGNKVWIWIKKNKADIV